MEGNAHLLQVIRKMRSQINKLERENRALRGELQVCGQRAAARGGGDGNARSFTNGGEGLAGSPAPLHGSSAAGPAPSAKQQTDTTMTVRRYSTASPVPAPPSARSRRAGERPPGRRLTDPPGSAPPPARPAPARLAGGEEKGLEKALANRLSNSHPSKMKLFQEHVYRCRGKVKAVSFLLPMDTSSSAENRGSLKSPQNQSTKQLTTITEKDM